MLTVLLVIQIFIAVALVTVILIQRTSSDGIAGLSGNSNSSFLSGRASANILTRTTAFLAVAFMVNSLLMATITARTSHTKTSVVETIQTETGKTGTPAVKTGTEKPEAPKVPTVPLSE